MISFSLRFASRPAPYKGYDITGIMINNTKQQASKKFVSKLAAWAPAVAVSGVVYSAAQVSQLHAFIAIGAEIKSEV